MNAGTEAAEQVVRMSLNGVEIAEITRDIRDLRKLLAIADRLQRKAQKVQKTVEDLENQVKGAFEQAKEKTAADKQQSRD